MKGKTTLTVAVLLIGFALSFPSSVSTERIARMAIPASPAAFAAVNGIEMHYRVVGKGSPSLLMPGGVSGQHV